MKQWTAFLLALVMLLLTACHQVPQQITDPTVQTEDLISERYATRIALNDKYGNKYLDYEKSSDITVELDGSEAAPYYTVTWIPRNSDAYIYIWKVDARDGTVLNRQTVVNPDMIVEAGAPETEPPTEPATDPVETTEPVVEVSYDLPVDAWLVEEPAYLSYEEYFSVDREYTGSSGSFWMKKEDTHWYTFGVSWQDDGLVIGGEITEDKYLVPDSLRYSGYEILSADGKYAYLWGTEIGRMNLVTGEYETLYLSGEIFTYQTYDQRVTYFLDITEVEGEKTLKVGRIYLPTGKVDILHEESAEDLYYLHLAKVYSSLGDVRWTKLNPNYITAMRKELANPDSKYKIGYYDNSEYWEAEDGIAMMLDHQYFMLLDEMEDGLGVRAQLMGIYNCESGKYSEKLGIFDGCWYGSGYPDDHFNPDVTTAPEPIAIKEKWFWVNEKADFTLCDVDGIGEDGTYVDGYLRIYADHTSTPYLYLEKDDIYTKVTDIPIKSALNTSKCIIAVTTDNRVLAMTYDGKEIAELYRSVYGEIENLDISYLGSYVAFLDGDYLILVDLEKQEYREVVYHENLDNFYLGALYGDSYDDILKEPEIYFEVCVGLYVNGFVVDLSTGEIDPGYRL